MLTCTQAITEQTSVQDVAHWISIFALGWLQAFEAYVLTLCCLPVRDDLSVNVARAGTAFIGVDYPGSGSELKQ